MEPGGPHGRPQKHAYICIQYIGYASEPDASEGYASALMHQGIVLQGKCFRKYASENRASEKNPFSCFKENPIPMLQIYDDFHASNKFIYCFLWYLKYGKGKSS
ncbi:MAG: hypothetical protein C0180_07105 [Aciduliprofundum sp.]|nr:MAG: hypothetical protein C0180_07105 [Aciduliprofundum sp.]